MSTIPMYRQQSSYPFLTPPAEETMSYPPSMPLHQSTYSVLPPTPPDQQNMPYSLPMLPNPSSMSYTPRTPQVQGMFQSPFFTPPNQSSMPYSPPTPQAHGTLQQSFNMLSNQSGMLFSPPMARLQETLQSSPSMPEGHTVNMATLSPPPSIMQTVLPYRPQTQPSVPTMSQQRLALPTPNTTAVDQTAPMPKKRFNLIWAVCIPCDGTRIHQKMFEIFTDISTGRHFPMLKNWWPEKDRTAKPMVRSLIKRTLGFGICLMSVFLRYIMPFSKSVSVEVRLTLRICLEPFAICTRSSPSRRQLPPLYYC